MKVVSATICPFVQRITALLEAKALPYEIAYIDLGEPPAWFLAASPNAQVPLLIADSGEVLFESDAIAEYLDEVSEPLQPALTPEQRALDRAWCQQASKHYLVQCSAMSSGDEAGLERGAARLAEAFDRVERALSAGLYFRGQTLGNVDAAWLPLLHRAALVERHSGFDFLAGHPRVKAWQRALLATGLGERSVAADFERVFGDFYLGAHTFLGAGCAVSGAGGGCCQGGACG